jgi:hypothetical protein
MSNISPRPAVICILALFAALIWIISPHTGQTLADQEKQPTSAEESTPMARVILHAAVQIDNIGDHQAELYLNDIPLARVGGNLQSWAAVPVMEYVVDGENLLTVMLGIGSTPSAAKSEREGATCEPGIDVAARLVLLKEGEMARPGAGELLAELTWTSEGGEPLPMNVFAYLDLGKQPDRWAWESADVLTLDSAPYESAAQFISEIAAAYTSTRPEPIIKVAGPKHSEAGVAYPEYGDIDFDDMFREQMTEAAEAPNWKPYALPRDQYDLRLIADGRMIEAVARDWRPIVRMEDGDYAFPMMIGRVNGEWLIMR